MHVRVCELFMWHFLAGICALLGPGKIFKDVMSCAGQTRMSKIMKRKTVLKFSLKHMSLVLRSMMSLFMLTLCLLSFVNFYLITVLPSNSVTVK